MKPSPGTDSGGYGAREISRMLGLTVAQVRAWVRSGLLEPERGPHGELRFSRHDLAVLRSARGLAGARIGPRRIERALSRLREQIPGRDSLEDLEIVAEGRQIVVTDGSARWQPESGQILMEFENVAGTGPTDLHPPQSRGNVSALTPGVSRRARREASASAGSWYARGCDLEETDPEGAREAYTRTLE